MEVTPRSTGTPTGTRRQINQPHLGRALRQYQLPGHTWDELVVESVGTTIFPLYWGVGQGVVNIVYDVYIFVLPLPVIYRLKLSRKRKAQVFAVFFIAVLYVQDSHQTDFSYAKPH